MKKRRVVLLKILDGLAIFAFVASFSPLVTPQHVAGPFVLGFPYALWTGLLVSFLFVILAYLVSVINKEENNAD
ncbi:hypothetical protein [Ulvibacterium sp.]|uniref:hypothetical protein n=1 Tax=Ulvibacterium sp. TaxID=2665914 RepID=UPI00262E3576|nr:hypothetical protein [Ulvibacterium sp.]